MSRYSGRTGLFYMSTTGTGTATAVISLTSWSLDMAQDKLETSSFGDANKTFVPALRDLSGAFEGNWDDAEAKIFTGAASADGVKLYLYPASGAISKYAYGPAWVDASIKVGVNEVVSVSGTFSANGSWDTSRL